MSQTGSSVSRNIQSRNSVKLRISPYAQTAAIYRKSRELPYKGSAPALTDVVAGHVPLLFSDPVPALPLIREGKVRVLGVSTKTRSPSAPDIPPIAEAGVPGFDAAGWGVFSVPAGTPKEVVSKLQTALTAVVAMPDVQQQIINLGMIPSGISSPEELERFIGSEIARWGKVVAQAGLAGTE